MSLDFLYPVYEVMRNAGRCTNCRVCERQCANGVHFWSEKTGRMESDESRCVNCHRCVAFCPADRKSVV